MHTNSQQTVQNTEYRIQDYTIQNTETPGRKITNVPVLYMVLGLNDFDAGKSITRAIGRGGP